MCRTAHARLWAPDVLIAVTARGGSFVSRSSTEVALRSGEQAFHGPFPLVLFAPGFIECGRHQPAVDEAAAPSGRYGRHPVLPGPLRREPYGPVLGNEAGGAVRGPGDGNGLWPIHARSGNSAGGSGAGR